MKLCTFEIKTKLGRYNRLGAVVPNGIIDVNFAAAYYLAQMGEAVPYQFANAIVPSDMLSFLQTENTGMRFAKETLNFFEKEFAEKNFKLKHANHFRHGSLRFFGYPFQNAAN